MSSVRSLFEMPRQSPEKTPAGKWTMWGIGHNGPILRQANVDGLNDAIETFYGDRDVDQDDITIDPEGSYTLWGEETLFPPTFDDTKIADAIFDYWLQATQCEEPDDEFYVAGTGEDACLLDLQYGSQYRGNTIYKLSQRRQAADELFKRAIRRR